MRVKTNKKVYSEIFLEKNNNFFQFFPVKARRRINPDYMMLKGKGKTASDFPMSLLIKVMLG